MHIRTWSTRLALLRFFSPMLILSLFSYQASAQHSVPTDAKHPDAPLRRHHFPDAGEKPIPNWTGPVFHLRDDYPLRKPSVGAQPWKKFDFTKQSEWKDYLTTVLRYCMEGNVEADWVLEKNKVRSWYHAPWMHWGPNGREFVHGLTHERSSRPKELAPTQVSSFQNWAVGMYNAPGGWIIGKVWKDPNHPEPKEFASFPDGTVSIKLLFTEANPAEVPYLEGSKEWDAYIYDKNESPINPNGVRKVKTMRLLQIDIAVRDVRNDSVTGWVFGTFTYNNALGGTSPYDKLVPIGIMWGNDPEASAPGDPLKETYINTSSDLPKQHLGWNGRLDGPVDNPMSSCLSCHSTSEWPVNAGMTPGQGAQPGSSEWMKWFRNIKSGEAFVSGSKSLDYSLQLASGIQNFHQWRDIVDNEGGAINGKPSTLPAHSKLMLLQTPPPKEQQYPVTRDPEM
jgi:hypothetical protein